MSGRVHPARYSIALTTSAYGSLVHSLSPAAHLTSLTPAIQAWPLVPRLPDGSYVSAVWDRRPLQAVPCIRTLSAATTLLNRCEHFCAQAESDGDGHDMGASQQRPLSGAPSDYAIQVDLVSMRSTLCLKSAQRYCAPASH
jgi:hypothetical protein